MSLFKVVKVKDVRKETDDTVSVAFDVDKNEFRYQSGQYITIQKEIDGEDIRRSYSLCSAPFENDFRIAVKKIEQGKMSTLLHHNINVGDELNIMLPAGNFTISDFSRKHIGFAAGSGITPLLSMIKSTLKEGGSFVLFYGNRTESSTIFKKEIDELLVKYPNQFNVTYIYSRENMANEIQKGRIDNKKVNELIKQDLEILKADGFYLCGPENMINAVKDTLYYLGVPKEKVHFELFTTPVQTAENKSKVVSDFKGTSQLTVIMDGEEFEFELAYDGDFILDASIDHGADAPFSCKGAVCCTCKAKVLEGKAVMEMNYSLSDEEVAQGYILTCQSHPASDKLVVDYDVT
ncbi:MAG: 2Fe-2S iron-sulfur cluster binding domain-containing protein [Bacteroidetes bacterium]|nr:2Fe-2S iron-sulfur cluster binding domain-containing protein [Bacteroidota bacterium]